MMTRYLKITITIIILILLVSSCCVGLRNLDYFNINTVNVNTNGCVSGYSASVDRIISPLKGLNIFTVSSSFLSSKIKSVECVKSVSVKKHYPSEIDIEIEYYEFPARIFTVDDDVARLYMADEGYLVPVSYDTYSLYTSCPEIEINTSYAKMLSKWKYDPGFEQMLVLACSEYNNSLITNVKYDNNNSNGFGRLTFELNDGQSSLYVREPVTKKRLYDALDVITEELSGSTDSCYSYDLYAATLVRRR